MKYVYYAAVVLLISILCYVVANRQTILLEHLENKSVTSGPMDGGRGPTPAMPDEDKGTCMLSLIDGMFSLGAIAVPSKCLSMKADFDTKVKEGVDALPDNERNICTSQLLEPTVKDMATKYKPGTEVSGDIARCLKVLYVKKLSSGGGGGGGGGGGDVAALTSKLTALQKEVDEMKNQAKDQTAQASAAQASLQSIK